MKKICLIAFALICISAQSLLSQEVWLWPVKGLETGKGIISRPNSYVGKELNFDNLFITAPEGTEIVSPVDGTIEYISVGYNYNLSSSVVSGSGKSFDEEIAEFIKEYPDINSKYVSGHICITPSKGIKIYINGLKGSQIFKTGQKIRKGDLLGYMAYSYKGFDEPNISVSVSHNSKADDPMTPFGLKTTFIHPKALKPIVSISETQALEDFQIFADAVEECYPTLYHCFTPAEFDSLKTWARGEIVNSSPDTTITYIAFRKLIIACFSQINDSHIYIFPTIWNNDDPKYQPAVWVGLFGDTMRITNANSKHKELFGRSVSRVNGIDADSARKVTMKRIYEYDADVQSYPQYRMAFNSLSVYPKENYDVDIEFSDGTVKSLPGIKYSQVRLLHNFMFRALNYQKNGFSTKIINDSTAYLGIGTFELNQVQVEGMKVFVDSVSKAGVPNFIVDVRNNYGGIQEVLEEIWSWFAQDTLKLNGCRRMNKVSDFKSFEYSDNYNGLEGELFQGYDKVEGVDGLCDTTFKQQYYPDTSVNYKGHLYVLTNEISVSAATLFPALTVRAHRGVTVGRETCTAYHFMTALKFVNIILPNSQVRFCLPLVEDVFDTQINDRVPYGRGVLPDYEVPLSFEEVTGDENQDLILDHALELIANNQYINYDDPFVIEQEETTSHMYLLYILGGVLVIVVILCLALRKKKSA